MIEKKICLVGSFGVGKTSLVQRFANDRFSATYQISGGVQIERKEIRVDGERVRMTLWDMGAAEQVERIPSGYLKGAAAILYVIDGTRQDTLETVLRIKRQAEVNSARTAFEFFLFNKSDLVDNWSIDVSMLGDIEYAGGITLLTSAKEGTGVKVAFDLIGRIVTGRTALAPAS